MINLSSPEPIYNQIIEQIKKLLEKGELKNGDPLPPIRTLASQLDISINTVARAYRELESEGIVESNGRRGSFIRKDRLSRETGQLFASDIKTLLQAGLKKSQIKELFNGELDRLTGDTL